MANTKKTRIPRRVTMEDGLEIIFSRRKNEVRMLLCNGGMINDNVVDESTIHAVIGEPLTFDYYYGYGSRDTIKTGTPVSKIEYKIQRNKKN